MCKDGQELRGLSPIKRQRLLKKIVKSPVLSADYLMGHGVDMFRAVWQRDLEGVVAKAAEGVISRRRQPVAFGKAWKKRN